MTVTRTYNKNVLMEEETHKQLITPNHKMLGKECCLQKCPSRGLGHRISKLAKQTVTADYAHSTILSIDCRPSFIRFPSQRPSYGILPLNVQYSPSLFLFHQRLKTFLFQKSFPELLL